MLYPSLSSSSSSAPSSVSMLLSSIMSSRSRYLKRQHQLVAKHFVCGKVEPPWKFALFLLRTNNRHTQKILKELVLVEVQDHVQLPSEQSKHYFLSFPAWKFQGIECLDNQLLKQVTGYIQKNKSNETTMVFISDPSLIIALPCHSLLYSCCQNLYIAGKSLHGFL